MISEDSYVRMSEWKVREVCALSQGRVRPRGTRASQVIVQVGNTFELNYHQHCVEKPSSERLIQGLVTRNYV